MKLLPIDRTMLPPVTYQGGKVRLADEIIAHIGLPSSEPFFDLCCGSGAVAVAAVRAGHRPELITMVDSSPWGLFWEAIGRGSFSLKSFRELVAEIPKDPCRVKQFITNLYQQPVDDDAVYVFLLLQAAAIGGSAVRIQAGSWLRSSGFRDYWTPTPTSSRRSPVNPMMPMPGTIIDRVALLADRMAGVVGICANLESNPPLITKGVAYIDPPYKGTTGYGKELDVVTFAKSLPIPCWVSEGKKLTDHAFCLSKGRTKGGITGGRKKAPNQEWLSLFRNQFTT